MNVGDAFCRAELLLFAAPVLTGDDARLEHLAWHMGLAEYIQVLQLNPKAQNFYRK